MVAEKKGIFREKSLQRLSSPERLDQTIRIIGLMDWLVILALALVVAAAIIWSVFGTIPTTVYGRGIILKPRTVIDFQSPASGYFMDAKIRTGAKVRKGQVMGTITQPQLETKLQQLQLRLAALRARHETAIALENQASDNEVQSIEKQRQGLKQQLAETQKLAQLLEAQLANIRVLKEAGAISNTSLLAAQEAFLVKRGTISELQSQIKELDSREKAIAPRTYQVTAGRLNEMLALQSEIAQTKQDLLRKTRLISPHNGTILTISTNLGKLVQEGQSLGTMENQDEDSELVALAYFKDADGKRIHKGMRMQISPDIVERERYGSIEAEVYKVSEFPITAVEVAGLVGKQDIANALVGKERTMQTVVLLKADPATFSGFKWTTSKGPPVKITTGTSANALVTLEERAPITYIIPLLRTSTGIY